VGPAWDTPLPHCGFSLLFFFILLFSCLHQAESNSVTLWTPSWWKASPRWAALRKVGAISPHCHRLQTCLCVNWRMNRWPSCTMWDSPTHSPRTKSGAATGQTEPPSQQNWTA
jgi:hypothetical protein